MINYLKIYEEVLTEASKQQLRQQFKDIDEDTFNEIFEADPYDGKYAQWLLSIYKTGNLSLEDLYKATEYLKIYHNIKNKLGPKHKDIYKIIKKQVQYVDSFDGKTKYKYEKIPAFKSLQDLFKIIKPYKEEGADLSKNEKLKKENLVYEDEKWEVYIPRTYQASCQLGSGTQWCTATGKTDKHYKNYSEIGSLYIFIRKQDRRDKYQFHFEQKQFMDKNDNPINFKNFLNGNIETFLSTKEIMENNVAMDIIISLYLNKNSKETYEKFYFFYKKIFHEKLPIVLFKYTIIITANDIYTYSLSNNKIYGYTSQKTLDFTQFLIENNEIFSILSKNEDFVQGSILFSKKHETFFDEINNESEIFFNTFIKNVKRTPLYYGNAVDYTKIASSFKKNLPYYEDNKIYTNNNIYLTTFYKLNILESLFDSSWNILTHFLSENMNADFLKQLPFSFFKKDNIYIMLKDNLKIFTLKHNYFLLIKDDKMEGLYVDLNNKKIQNVKNYENDSNFKGLLPYVKNEKILA